MRFGTLKLALIKQVADIAPKVDVAFAAVVGKVQVSISLYFNTCLSITYFDNWKDYFYVELQSEIDHQFIATAQELEAAFKAVLMDIRKIGQAVWSCLSLRRAWSTVPSCQSIQWTTDQKLHVECLKIASREWCVENHEWFLRRWFASQIMVISLQTVRARQYKKKAWRNM